MKFNLSIHARDVMAARKIVEEWVYSTIDNPTSMINVNEQEIHYFSTIRENEGRCLKVVVNPLKHLIVTAYFDRKMKKRGCK